MVDNVFFFGKTGRLAVILFGQRGKRGENREIRSDSDCRDSGNVEKGERIERSAPTRIVETQVTAAGFGGSGS
jgi:hypothetical protein